MRIASAIRWAKKGAETAAELEALRRSVVRGQPYGSEAWQQQTAKQMGLQYTFRPQGRPRKRPSGSKSD